ncbi:MAG: hypothetical protein AAF634_04715 [Bacteroidota bacterium]
MDFLTSRLPIWVSLLFLIAIPIPVFLVARLAFSGALKHTNYKKARNLFWGILLCYFGYFAYVTIACLKGLFAQPGLPPRIMVLSAIPLLLVYIIIVLQLPLTKKILRQLDLSDLVRIHIFRLIGGFFLLMGWYGVVPKTFSLAAGLGDITIALTSIWVSATLVKRKPYRFTVTLLWNTLGLLDILMTSFMAFWFTKQAMDGNGTGVQVLTEFPFCFIPAFAPATIIFLHLCTYKKLLSKA